MVVPLGLSLDALSVSDGTHRLRLKISFADRFQDELDCPLDYAVPDGGHRKNADFSPVLRDLLLRVQFRGPTRRRRPRRKFNSTEVGLACQFDATDQLLSMTWQIHPAVVLSV